MMATALGAVPAGRDVRRSFRQGAGRGCISLATWAVLWKAEVSRAARAGAAWPATPRFFSTATCGASAVPAVPGDAQLLSALERPAWIFIVSALGIVLNAIVSWALIFGRLGMPALGIFGGGLGSSIVWTVLTVALGIVIVTDRKFRRFHLFGRFWRADWPRFRHIWRLGLPIGLTMAFEGAVFGAAAYLMGLIDSESIAAMRSLCRSRR